MRTKSVFAFLFRGYCEELWWWEITVVARKVFFVFVAVSFATSTGMQLLLMQMIAILSLYFQMTYQPWGTAGLNRLETWSSLFVLSALSFSLMLYLEGLGQSGRYVASLGVLISLWGFIGLFVVYIWREMHATKLNAVIARTTSPIFVIVVLRSQVKCRIPNNLLSGKLK